jgi:hypothetical protein
VSQKKRAKELCEPVSVIWIGQRKCDDKCDDVMEKKM